MFSAQIPPLFLHGNLQFEKLVLDYKRALKKHRVTWSEYFSQYEFYKLSEIERSKFVSCSNVQKMYRRLVRKDVRELMHDKEKFLVAFEKYIYRRWICLVEGNAYKKDELKNMLKQGNCIVKPISGSLGSGVRKISMQDILDIDTVSMGKIIGVDTSIQESIISLSSALLNKDLKDNARTIQYLLGMDDLTIEDISKAII